MAGLQAAIDMHGANSAVRPAGEMVYQQVDLVELMLISSSRDDRSSVIGMIPCTD